MKSPKLMLLGAAAAVMLTACGQGASGPPSVTSVNPGSPQYATMQFAVGTANIGGTATGLNVVTTFRQNGGSHAGASAALVNSPQLLGPGGALTITAPGSTATLGTYDTYSTLPAGPSTSDAANGVLTSTSPAVRLGTPPDTTNITTFGQSGGVFALGIEPFNNQVGGASYSFAPYPVPLFAAASMTTMTPWGGPPAFDPNKDNEGFRDGQHDLADKILGVSLGLDVFNGITPTAATAATPYTLNVQVPTGMNSNGQESYATVTQTATLSNTTVLGTIATPAFTSDGAGGGTITFTAPAGVTESLVQVIDLGPGGLAPGGGGAANCQGTFGTSLAPVYYTIKATGSGVMSATLPDMDGPNLAAGQGSTITPSPSLCTATANTAAAGGTTTPGDDFVIQVYGVDYPLYEASPMFTGVAAPAITGSNGQSDITISPEYTSSAAFGNGYQ